MLGCVVGPPAWQPDEAPERGAVDYGAAALRAHVAKLVLHAGPHTAKIDGVHAIEVLGRLIGRVTRRNLDAGIVERHVQAAEAGDSAFHHRGGLRLVRHIAGDAHRLVPCQFQLVGGGTQRRLVDIGEHDGGARLGEGPRCSQSHAGAGAGYKGDLASEVIDRIHVLLTSIHIARSWV